jgi:hypothetical protein
MHTFSPPTDALTDWLKPYGTVNEGYGHLLLEQIGVINENLIDALKPYFESAHLDAREYFHAQIGISLHPDAVNEERAVSYPNCLPSKAHRGLFGEVIAGLVTEAYQKEFVGAHTWCVPIFLFREHDDAEKYLWSLRYDLNRTREIYGRHGTDFIAISLDVQGEVCRVISGEAKWRSTLTPSVINGLLLGPKERDNNTGELAHNGRGIWFELNRDTPIPHGLRQLQKLLEQRAPNEYANAILSIDRAVLGQNPALNRTNLVLIVGNGAGRRKPMECLIPWEDKPEEYLATHDLQVVEVILNGGDALIDELYNKLWEQA